MTNNWEMPLLYRPACTLVRTSRIGPVKSPQEVATRHIVCSIVSGRFFFFKKKNLALDDDSGSQPCTTDRFRLSQSILSQKESSGCCSPVPSVLVLFSVMAHQTVNS